MVKNIISICLIVISMFLINNSYSSEANELKAVRDICFLYLAASSGHGSLNDKGKNILRGAAQYLLRKYPDSPYTAFVKGIFNRKMKPVLLALKKYPKNPELLYVLGQLYGIKNKHGKELVYYNKAIKHKSRLVYKKFASIIHYFKGNVLRFKNKNLQALKEYRIAVKIYPKFARAFINIGVIYSNKLNKKKEALKFFKKAIQINSKLYNAYLNIAIIFLQNAKTIYDKLTPEQRKKPFLKKDKILMNAWNYLIQTLEIIPPRFKKKIKEYLDFAYSMMDPSLKATLKSMEKDRTYNYPEGIRIPNLSVIKKPDSRKMYTTQLTFKNVKNGNSIFTDGKVKFVGIHNRSTRLKRIIRDGKKYTVTFIVIAVVTKRNSNKIDTITAIIRSIK